MGKFNLKNLFKKSNDELMDEETEEIISDIRNELNASNDRYFDGKIDETSYIETLDMMLGKNKTRYKECTNATNLIKSVDLSPSMKQIRNELSSTDIETLDIVPTYVECSKYVLPGQTEDVEINSKYRLFGNRKKKQRELTALHKVYIKGNQRDIKPTLITIMVNITATNIDGMTQGTSLLMQWSLYVAEAIIVGDNSLARLLPKDYEFPEVEDMCTRSKQFDAALIYSSTDKTSLNGECYKHSTIPMTMSMVNDFSKNENNVSYEPVTITNQRNPQYYQMTNLYNKDN